MMSKLRFDYLLSLTPLVMIGCAGPQAQFGEPMRLTDRDAVSAEKVLAEPDSYHDKFVRVRGRVADVCAHRGCWLEMRGADEQPAIFVKFTCPVEGRLVPMEAIGHEAIVEGTLRVTEISEAEARHLEEDRAGSTPDDIAKIIGPQKQVRMNSPAVIIKGLEQPPPPTS